ncbi:hypothetical protein EYF80_033730 [Liparis tanakae]|uniref:Uncharacterized protein n=1 Tax=Liparis tanakae TaxID=230148 RepID=A0A4Z2GTS4_9TELE|nr:hypothetical protein EYF80_033730 [Liparis tanakae]
MMTTSSRSARSQRVVSVRWAVSGCRGSGMANNFSGSATRSGALLRSIPNLVFEVTAQCRCVERRGVPLHAFSSGSSTSTVRRVCGDPAGADPTSPDSLWTAWFCLYVDVCPTVPGRHDVYRGDGGDKQPMYRLRGWISQQQHLEDTSPDHQRGSVQSRPNTSDSTMCTSSQFCMAFWQQEELNGFRREKCPKASRMGTSSRSSGSTVCTVHEHRGSTFSISFDTLW